MFHRQHAAVTTLATHIALDGVATCSPHYRNHPLHLVSIVAKHYGLAVQPDC